MVKRGIKTVNNDKKLISNIKIDVRCTKKRTYLAVPVLYFIILCLSFPMDAQAAWPFGSSAKDEPYVAKVGDDVIATKDFEKKVRMLHTSDRVGEKLSKGKSFETQNFKKYLDELIEERLIVLEAERLELTKDPAFIRTMENHKLNLFLGRLRKDEVLGKIKIEESEIETRYRGAKGGETPAGQKAGEKKDDSYKRSHEWQMARQSIVKERTAGVQKKYFDKLRKKARIRLYEDVIKGVTAGMPAGELHDVIAKVNGKPVYAMELVRALKRPGARDDFDAKKRLVNSIVMRKLLDEKALNHGYENDPLFKSMLKKQREELLVELFKKNVIVPLIKVTEEDITEYYNANPDKVKSPGRFNVGYIDVVKEEDAVSIVKELEKGADFEYLSKAKAVGPSKKKGGMLGWVSADRFPDDVQVAINKAEIGDLVGPMKVQEKYGIFYVLGKEKGGTKPLDEVRIDITRELVQKEYRVMHAKYVDRLKKVMKVEINEAELGKVAGN